MAIKVVGLSSKEVIERHAMAGWQCPECYGVQVNRFESRFGGPSEDSFECNECGCTWGRQQ